VTEHTYKQFDTDIDAMRSAFTTMGGLVERQVIRAVDAIRLGDLRLAAQVMADERVVNQLHLESDLRCNQVIARRQPIAVDLREIIAILHSVNDLERIGDEAKKIALKTTIFADRPMPIPFDRVAEMASIATEMLRAAIDAFLRQDVTAAERMFARDQEVDALRDELVQMLVGRMSESSNSVQESLAMVFVVQSLERIGDHAKNIAEYVVTVVSGVDPRHSREKVSTELPS
jgi:phosphate transport system protein